MKKAICIPDSFKGTLSSSEICSIMTDAIKRRFPDCETVSIPVADGGEGSVDCFLSALGGEQVTMQATGPFGQMVDAYYGLIDGGATAVVEMAACAGLPLVGEQKNPLKEMCIRDRCAALVGAKHNIPIHMKPQALFDRAMAEAFDTPNRLIVEPGETITLS